MDGLTCVIETCHTGLPRDIWGRQSLSTVSKTFQSRAVCCCTAQPNAVGFWMWLEMWFQRQLHIRTSRVGSDVSWQLQYDHSCSCWATLCWLLWWRSVRKFVETDGWLVGLACLAGLMFGFDFQWLLFCCDDSLFASTIVTSKHRLIRNKECWTILRKSVA